MSNMSVGTAYVQVEPDFTGLNQKVRAQIAPLAKDFGGKFGKAMGPVMAQQSKHLETFSRAAKIATVGAAGLAAYGFKDVVEAGAQFEKQMDTNAAISEATRRQMALLEKQAIRLGKATFFSANETAEAQAELIKGGLKVKQVLGGGLPAALSLAEAGQLDLATAAETTVNAMKLFGLRGKEASSVADMLSTAANRTTADVLDFAVALKQGGSVTKLAGYDMDSTITVLEALAEAGIKNSDAGTSMKTAVIQLLKPTKKQAELAKELNLHLTTQAGTLKSAAGLSKELRLATGDMTKAERAKTLATLAGTDGVRTLNALYMETPAHLRALEAANAKQGTAQEIASKKMDNFAGQWEQFKGSLETAEIQIYKGMAPALKDLTEEATKAANRVTAVFEDPNLSGSQKVEKAIEVLSHEVGAIWDRNDMTDHLVDLMDAAIPIVAEHAGKLGFEATKGFVKGFFHADLIGKAVMATWLVHFIGGKAPFIAFGKRLGRQFGITMAEEAAATAAPVIAGKTATMAAAASATSWTPTSPWLGSAAAKQKAAEKTARALLEQEMSSLSLAAMGSTAEAAQVSRFSNLGTKLGQVTGARMTEQLAGALRGSEPTLQARFRSIGGRLAGAIGTWGLGGLIAGEITKDVVGGDVGRDLGNALQGAGVGAAIGSAIAPGIGTAIGAALGAGALAGPGFLEDIFGSEKDLTPLQERLRASAKQVAEAFKDQRSAARNLVASNHRLSAAQEGQKQADHAVKRATEQLADARKRYGRNSNEAARAEQRLREQKALSAVADRKLQNAEKLHGVERRAVIRMDRAAVIAAKENIQALQRKQSHLLHLLRIEQQQPPSQARLEGERKLSRQLNETSKKLTSTKEKEARVIKEAATQIGGKYARSLERLSTSELRVVESGRSLKQANREAAEAVFGFARKAVSGTGKVKSSYEHLKGAMGPFRSESHNALIRAAGDVDSWKQAATKGIGTVQTSFNQFAARLGIASTTYGVSGGGNSAEQKRQKGGFIVPGSGDGDTFRTALPSGSFILNREAVKAMTFAKGGLMPVALEPGEAAIPPHEVKAMGGSRVLEAINQKVPRFQKGGQLGRPVLTGPDGSLKDLGQAAIDQVYKGAKAYLDKHRPSLAGVGGSVKDHPELQAGISAIIATVLKRWPGLSITSTTGGGHATNSLHYEGRAADLAAGSGYMLKAAAWIRSKLGPLLTEGIHNPNLSVKYGKNVGPGFWGPEVWADHFDHIHLGKQRGGLIREIQRLVKGGWVKTGYTTYDEDGPGAFGDLMKGKGYAELGTATSGGAGTGSGFIAKALGMSGELPKDFPLDVKIGSIGKVATLFKRDRGYGQGNPYWSIDIHRLAWPSVGLHGNNKGDAFIRPADGASGGHDIPKVKTGAYGPKPGSTSKGGGTAGPRSHYKVQTAKLDFGALPSNLDACTKELRIRQRQLREYRAAIRDTHNREEKQAYEVNARALEKRIRELHQQRTRLIAQGAVKKIRDAAEFSAWTKPHTGIFDKHKDAYEYAQEIAEQTVSLEPEEPSGAGANWIKTVLEPYVNGVESPAFAKVLGAEAEWRNSILSAEDFAGKKMVDWRKQIGDAQERIAAIQALKDKDPKQYERLKDLIPGLRQRVKALRGDIVKTRGETLPEWEEALGGVQGLGRSHEIRDVLPSEPTMEFGGNIFETQQAIRDLGLKVTQAMENVSSDSSERDQMLEELLRQANQRLAVSERLSKTTEQFDATYPPYAGKAHGGAIVPGPPTQERTLVVKGREGVFTEEQMAAMGGLVRGGDGASYGGPPVHIEQITIHEDGSATVKFPEREVEAVVGKVLRTRTGIGRITPGGGDRRRF
jgi:TP901 family phage tail tape measure protein